MASEKPQASSRSKVICDYKPNLTPYEDAYKDIHAHPELSCQESRTASIVAQHLRSLGVYEIKEKIGGHGVVGVFRNGEGPNVLLRADMDALPVHEETGLEYASKRRGTNSEGKDVPIMHACGHDMHTATLMAAAATLASAKDHWCGTLIILFQPNEESVSGAQAMVDDGLYGTKHSVPIPDIVLGQHVLVMKTGTVAVSPGPVLTAEDSLSIRVFGQGGHGSRPDLCIDPVLIAAHIVVRLQSVTTCEVKPGELVVLTCGSIQGGETANIIPNYADIKLSIRSCRSDMQERVVAAVHRVVRAECEASSASQDPEFTTISHGPATVNDAPATDKLIAIFKEHFGTAVTGMDPTSASEDVSILARAVDKPYVYWAVGGVDAQTWDDAAKENRLQALPYNHSSRFAPAIQPTMATGVDALTLAALTFLGQA